MDQIALRAVAARMVMSLITLRTVSSIGLSNSSLNSSRIVVTRKLKTAFLYFNGIILIVSTFKGTVPLGQNLLPFGS